MAPETRSRGKPAPSRVYHSSPALRQAQFPSNRNRIRTTYGKQTPKSEPRNPRNLRQQTLTQIDFVSSLGKDDDPIVLTDSEAEDFAKDEDGLNKENEIPSSTAEIDEDDEDEDEGPVPSGRKRRSVSRLQDSAPGDKQKTKRRRTLGDSPDVKGRSKSKPKGAKASSRRRTLGDSPAPPPAFHTQTLTQLMRPGISIQDSDDDDDGHEHVLAEDDGFDSWLGAGVPGSPSPRHRNQASNRNARPTAKDQPDEAIAQAPSRDSSVIPATPVKRIRFEIPSSSQQSTPPTSMMARYGPAGTQPSPLKGRSPSVAPVLNELPGKPKSPLVRSATPRHPRMVVQDSFGTEGWGSVNSSPTKQTSPREREALSEIQLVSSRQHDLGTPTKPRRKGGSSELGETRKKAKSPSPRKRTTRLEIPDSDDDEDDLQDEDDAVPGSEGFAFDAGAETQLAMDEVAELYTSSAMVSSRPPGTDNASSNNVTRVASSQTTAQPIPSSPPKANRLPTHPPTAKPLRRQLHQPSSHITSTCPAESQRVPLTVLQAWPPASMRTDILLPLSSSILSDVIAGFQIHIIVPFKILAQVVRLWLFDGSILRFMACPQPGTQSTDGTWRYHLSQVYELNNAVEKNDMQEEGWIDGPIGRYVYLPPAVVGQLLWNLRHAIFDDDAPANSSPSPSVTLSQQVEAQIRSDIAYSTQLPTSDGILVPSTPEAEVEVEEQLKLPSSRTTRPTSLPSSQLPPPPQPKPIPQPTHAITNAAPVRPSQATTASQASTGPTHSSIIRQRRRLSIPPSSSPSYQDYGESLASGALPGVSLTSSQPLLTKSQTLSDSLVCDDSKVPPSMWDLDDDDDA